MAGITFVPAYGEDWDVDDIMGEETGVAHREGAEGWIEGE